MASFFTELKRRNVFKVGIAYGIIAWLLIQIVATVFPILELPDWSVRLITVVILLGFPLAVFLAWAYEVTPEGVKPTREVNSDESVTPVTGRKFDFVIIGLLGIAVVYLLVDRVSVEEAPEPKITTVSEEMPAAPVVPIPPAEPAEEQPAPIPNSVAVLPLDNLSPDPEEAYFAIGIHEEILNQLVKLRNLNVMARTTMRQYRNTEKSIQEIARELNVESVIEGSVRYANDQVRITIQLIEAETGTHLWSETYDREFKDIFAIESNIAMNVANALEAEFSLEEQASIEEIPTDSPAAYAMYLRSFDTRNVQLNSGVRQERIGSLDRAIELDPEFALAMVRRANQTLSLNNGLPPESWKGNEKIAQDFAERALAVDPTIGSAYVILMRIHYNSWRLQEAKEALESAHEISPDGLQAVGGAPIWGLQIFLGSGQLPNVKGPEELLRRESFHAAGITYARAGNLDSATMAFQKAVEKNPLAASSYWELSRVESRKGSYAQALEYANISEGLAQNPSTQGLAILAWCYGLAGSRTDAARLLEKLQARSEEEFINSTSWLMAYLGVGDQEEAFTQLQQIVDNKELNPPNSELVMIKVNFHEDPILDLPEFVELRDRLGAVD